MYILLLNIYNHMRVNKIILSEVAFLKVLNMQLKVLKCASDTEAI